MLDKIPEEAREKNYLESIDIIIDKINEIIDWINSQE